MDVKTRLLLAFAGSWNGIKRNVLMPVLARTGTAIATLLAMHLGATEDLAQQVATGVTALGLILFDLAVSWMNRRTAVAEAKAEVIQHGR